MRWMITFILGATLVFVLLAQAGIRLPVDLSEDARYVFTARAAWLAVMMVVVMLLFQGGDGEYRIIDVAYILPVASATAYTLKLRLFPPELLLVVVLAIAVLACAYPSWRWHPQAQQSKGAG